MVVTFPLSTGQVVRLLGCREHRVQEAVRRQVVAPEIAAGRRLWTNGEVLFVARHLGLDTLAVRNHCREPVQAKSEGVA